MDTSWEHRIQICLWTFRLGILYTAIAPSQIVLANCLDYQRFNAIAHTMSRHRHTGFAIIMLDLKSTEHLKLATVYKIVRGYWSMPKRENDHAHVSCLSQPIDEMTGVSIIPMSEQDIQVNTRPCPIRVNSPGRHVQSFELYDSSITRVLLSWLYDALRLHCASFARHLRTTLTGGFIRLK